MSSLVQRLRDAANWVHEQKDPEPDYEALLIEAANEITRLLEYEWMYKDLNDEDYDEDPGDDECECGHVKDEHLNTGPCGVEDCRCVHFDKTDGLDAALKRIEREVGPPDPKLVEESMKLFRDE